MNKSQQLTKTLVDFYHKPVAQVSLELFLSIGAVLFFIVFAIQPTLITMSELIKELEDKRALDQQLSQKIAALSSAQTTYLQIEPQIPLLFEAIPKKPQLKETLLVLEKIASDRNLVIDTIVVKEVPREVEADMSKSSVKRTIIPVVVTVTGTYPNISGYLQDILNIRRTIMIESIVFTRTEERGSEVLRTNITLGLPYFSESASAGETTPNRNATTNSNSTRDSNESDEIPI